jgi:glycoprotein endo-alpha-1,2-mannosidase
MSSERLNPKYLRSVLLVVFALGICSPLETFPQTTNSFFQFVTERSQHCYTEVPHEVLAFYYPWYGTPERHGHWVHWENVRSNEHDIASVTHYPVRGAYDSHDPAIIDWHIQSARTNGVTGFISSWWGRNGFEDRVVPLLLDCAGKQNFKISVYWETAPGKGSEQIARAVEDLTYLVNRYGASPAFLKVNGKPVIFVYGRVLEEVPLESWAAIITGAHAKAGDFLLIADGYAADYGRLFDGLHTYNVASSVAGKNPAELRTAIASEYLNSVKAARRFSRISCLTVIPGYDDTKIRKPGLKADRFNGQTYRVLWDEATKANPDWILITSWNEWHEGSEIEPSFEDGEKYLNLTGELAPRFCENPKVAVAAPTAPNSNTLQRLQKKFSGRTIGLLPGAKGDVLFWLHAIGADVHTLTWPDVVDSARFNSRTFPVVVFAGGEHYTGTVNSSGDVKEGLVRYLATGGFMVIVPSEPWPFYYDDSRGALAFPITGELGLPIVTGNEQLSSSQMFVNTNALPGIPGAVKFSLGGDLRWRPCVPLQAPKGDTYLSLVQLRDTQDRFSGDAAAYIEHVSPPLTSGKTIYVWTRTAEILGADDFFPSLFELINSKLEARP